MGKDKDDSAVPQQEQLELVKEAVHMTKIGQELIEEGRANGVREIIIETLQNRFGEIPDDVLIKLNETKLLDRLRSLLKVAQNAEDLLEATELIVG